MGEPTAGVEAIRVTRWRCPSCRKSWSSKATAEEHAVRCWLDPANRACKTCKHHHPGDHWTWEEPPAPECCVVGVDMCVDRYGEPTELPVVQAGCPMWESLW